MNQSTFQRILNEELAIARIARLREQKDQTVRIDRVKIGDQIFIDNMWKTVHIVKRKFDQVLILFDGQNMFDNESVFDLDARVLVKRGTQFQKNDVAQRNRIRSF